MKKAPAPRSERSARPSVLARHFEARCDASAALRLFAELAADQTVLEPTTPRQPLALYGAGNLGRLARDHLRAVGEDFAAVIDRNAEVLANEPAWSGIPVLHPDAVDLEFKGRAMLAVSIATSPYAPLETALQAAGWGEVVPFYDIAESFRARHPLSNGWFAAPFSETDKAAIVKVLERWDDDLSRAHHLQFLAWRRLRQEWTFADAPVTLDDRFFIPQVMDLLSDDEIFIDAGAHHGSVTERFVRGSNNRFRDVFAIEPDCESRALLTRTVARLPACQEARVTIIDALLDSESRMVPFHQGLGYASQIAATGSDLRRSATLDSFGLCPSLLKLHLEGGELAALKGGAETISRHRPIIAATVYHDADGLYSTAQWLMERLENYRFLFRLHSWCGTGAVVYAIPRERQS